MKKRIFTLMLIAGLMSLNAFSALSDLTLSIAGNSNFHAKLDGKVFYFNSNTLYLGQLTPGNHFLEVFKEVYIPGSGAHGTVTTAIFSGYVSIPSGFSITAMIDRFNRYVVLTETPLKPYVGYYGNTGYNGYYGNSGYNGYYGTGNFPNYGNNGNGHGNGHGGNGNSGYNGYYGNGGNSGYGSGCSGGMSEAEFFNLSKVIRNTAFDDSKLAIAENAIASNSVSSAHVKGLMLLLSFDSNRLELAKYAYNFTIDKGSYFIVLDALTFDSNKRELLNYINH